jgi:hypothetical protein
MYPTGGLKSPTAPDSLTSWQIKSPFFELSQITRQVRELVVDQAQLDAFGLLLSIIVTIIKNPL